MLLKIKPDVIIKDMKHHPELLNNTNQFENKLNKIDLTYKTHTNIEEDPKINSKNYSSKKNTFPNTYGSTPRNIILDHKIDPSKPIILDISIDDSGKKANHTSKLVGLSRLNENKNTKKSKKILLPRIQNSNLIHSPRRNIKSKKEGRLMINLEYSPQPWNPKAAAIRRDIDVRTDRERSNPREKIYVHRKQDKRKGPTSLFDRLYNLLNIYLKRGNRSKKSKGKNKHKSREFKKKIKKLNKTQEEENDSEEEYELDYNKFETFGQNFNEEIETTTQHLTNSTIFRANGRCCGLREAEVGKILFRPKLLVKHRQISQNKININVPPAVIQKKIDKDEEFYDPNNKYSIKRIKKMCQKVKNYAMGNSFDEQRGGPIRESDSEEY